jgi:hypothetical protein
MGCPIIDKTAAARIYKIIEKKYHTINPAIVSPAKINSQFF